MDKPKIAGRSPIKISVEAGKKYSWCSCGLSTNQPFCDGSHKGGSFTPIRYEATETKDVHFCTCKMTGNPGLCDGTHKNLKQEEE